MNHQNLAVVLGGGRAAGNAWMIGVGQAEAGVDLTAADLVIGTSSGATTAGAFLKKAAYSRTTSSTATSSSRWKRSTPTPRPVGFKMH